MEGIGGVGCVGAGGVGVPSVGNVNTSMPLQSPADNPQGMCTERVGDTANVSDLAHMLLDNEALAKLMIQTLMCKQEASVSQILILAGSDDDDDKKKSTIIILAQNSPFIDISMQNGQTMLSLKGTLPTGSEANIGLVFSAGSAGGVAGAMASGLAAGGLAGGMGFMA